VTDADAALEKLAKPDYGVAIFVAAPDREVVGNSVPLCLSELDRVLSHVRGIGHCNSSLPMIVISERGEVLSEHAKVWDYEVAPASTLHDRAGFADVVSAANVYPRVAEFLKKPYAGAVQTTLAGVPALQL
jgi:hypothetical protein